ncbi:HTH-type transcriptional regulator MhqR [Clostridium luticellarii]|uniref:HTH-type transcriptional regulator MhqR n=1 Tax=Clostridium luticellarii TaxID=1691940 RepID=A0A2T0BLH1_9CLOT|nr:HTH-type transcriptional regulator MhqR [Clostridium luticellarii]
MRGDCLNKKYEEQVEELSRIWHSMIMEPNYKSVESQFSRIHGLSTVEIGVLRIISEKEDVIIKDIVDILKIPKSTLTSVINRLEKRKLIKRTISSRDKRSYKLVLTQEGILAQEEHIEFEKNFYARIMECLDTCEEREELLKLMKKITYNLRRKGIFQ